MSDALDALINPVKAFDWEIRLAGIPQFLAQKITLPTFEMGLINHSAGSYDVQSPGRIKPQTMKVESLMRSDLGDVEMWAWLLSCQNYDPSVLSNNFAKIYKPVQVILKNPGGISRVQAYNMFAFPFKYEVGELDKNGEANLMKTVEFACVRYMPV